MGANYRDLIVWQKAVDLAVDVYRMTTGFPREENYGLTSQMRRAGVSVASNIAEGQGRLTTGEFCQFLGHSRGSLQELETQCEVSRRLGLLAPEAAKAATESSAEIHRMLNGLISKLET